MFRSDCWVSQQFHQRHFLQTPPKEAHVANCCHWLMPTMEDSIGTSPEAKRGRPRRWPTRTTQGHVQSGPFLWENFRFEETRVFWTRFFEGGTSLVDLYYVDMSLWAFFVGRASFLCTQQQKVKVQLLNSQDAHSISMFLTPSRVLYSMKLRHHLIWEDGLLKRGTRQIIEVRTLPSSK